ncbi:MAG: carbamoyl-phosphate synthase large subunit, partial [Defluviitaleaceae bacterium]|nr:carbamoyl-phosphate synthase large subunit [Defluviitaleaceae bacterium]
GEVMAIADNFEEALLKAVRGAELGLDSLELPRLQSKSDARILELLRDVTDQRIFIIYEAIKRGISIDELYKLTQIDRWFLRKIANLANAAKENKPTKLIYKTVDTCAGEFEAKTPYFYSLHDINNYENEALHFIEKSEREEKQRIIVLGSGPIRIGQGIEFDYACVHCVWTLREMGYEVVVINNNPETVSTDFDTANRLYFEPLHIDDVMSVIEIEKPIGVIAAFGGGTAIKLTKQLDARGIPIIGTSSDAIDICENRERFDNLLSRLDIPRPKGYGIMTAEEAKAAAEKLGYPVLLRPSYVLGGQNMIIAHSCEDVEEYMEIILSQKQENPVLIDKYLKGMEIEVDAICDGVDVLIPGIMEHIESAGIHSGDSIAVYPPVNIDNALSEKLFETTRKICMALNVRGLINIQYVLHKGEIYVIEVNPRASRTVPYISKVTDIPMIELATKTAMGQTLADLGYKSGIAKASPYTAVKVPVFSFEKLEGLDTHLGPEMKSTGEVLGLGRTLGEALYKGLVAAGYSMRRDGGVFVTARDADKKQMTEIAKKFLKLGFSIYATEGTAKYLVKEGIAETEIEIVKKIYQSPTGNNTSTLLESGKISYILSTSDSGRNPARDDAKIRRKACKLGITCLTSPDTANAIADTLLLNFNQHNTEIIDINRI